MLYMSLFVLVPLAAVVAKAVSSGAGTLWDSIDNELAIRALVVTMAASLIVAGIGAVMGTLVAWVLVRDRFPGKRFVNAL
ncbi:MAG: molybdate ABC transporter permease subunit, partial [Solirubrobacterales bacterium]|nr:molybdate ABC transporter permease subunit [Solirubrobacterales bacterium]